jgi:predicted patatin/cPLA2 family phospholipase
MVFVVFLTLLKHLVNGECLGLAIEAGGSRGSYEAGLISVITDPAEGLNVKYNVMTGVSIGALTLNSIGGFPMGQELQMSQFLNQLWFNITDNSDIFVEWKGGLIDGLLFHQGLYNIENGISFFHKFSKVPVRNVTVGSTNLDLGTFVNFNESLGIAFFDACVSSGSIPIFFPPHQFVGHSWIDGGVVLSIDIPSAVERCLTVTDESSTTIDIILDIGSKQLNNDTSFKTLQVFERMIDIQQYDLTMSVLYNAMQAYPKVNFRYLFTPSQPLGSMLNFTKVAIQENFNIGVADAKKILNDSGHSPRKIVRNKLLGLSKIEFP